MVRNSGRLFQKVSSVTRTYVHTNAHNCLSSSNRLSLTLQAGLLPGATGSHSIQNLASLHSTSLFCVSSYRFNHLHRLTILPSLPPTRTSLSPESHHSSAFLHTSPWQLDTNKKAVVEKAVDGLKEKKSKASHDQVMTLLTAAAIACDFGSV